MPKGRFQIFPDLTPQQYSMLEEDIKARGVMVPVEVDDDGNILDGHNRVAIAKKHGIQYDTIVRHFQSDEEKKEHAVKLNLCRRQMSDVTWAGAFVKLCESRGVTPGKRGPKGKRHGDGTNSPTISELAKEVGVSPATARNRMKAARDLETTGDKYKHAIRGKGKAKVADVRKEIPEEKPDDGFESLKRAWNKATTKGQDRFRKWIK